MSRLQIRAAKLVVFSACLAPIVLLALRVSGLYGSDLGPNPVQEVLHVVGKTGLNTLLLTLAVSPLRRLTHVNALIKFRRMLGLFSFFYVTVHFCVYAILDLRLAWDTLYVDITERPYITVGMAALTLMIPLAVTSTTGWQRRLKRRWVTLHLLVYPAAVLGLLHFFWQTKIDILEPTIYAAVLAVLLGERLWHRVRVARRRQ